MAQQAHPPLRGLVLAGGTSQRMGTDKASLQVGGRTLLARSVGLLQPLVTAVHVAIRANQANDPLRRQFRLLIDAPGLRGPAAALTAAWLHDPDCAWLVLACDMPAVEPDTLASLIAARDPARGGTAWRGSAGELPEPLCAIWEPATLARLAAAAGEAGQGPDGPNPSPRALLAAADPLLLKPARPAALNSVNTPADLHLYLEHTHGHKP